MLLGNMNSAQNVSSYNIYFSSLTMVDSLLSLSNVAALVWISFSQQSSAMTLSKVMVCQLYHVYTIWSSIPVSDTIQSSELQVFALHFNLYLICFYCEWWSLFTDTLTHIKKSVSRVTISSSDELPRQCCLHCDPWRHKPLDRMTGVRKKQCNNKTLWHYVS